MRLIPKIDFDKIRGIILFGFKKNIIVEKNCIIKRPKTINFGGNNYIARFSEIHSSEPGKISIGKNTRICRHNFIFDSSGFIKIGDDCLIGDYCTIYGHGGVIIGNNVVFASHVNVIASEHNYKDINLSILKQPSTHKGIKIGDGSWLGINVTVLDGSEIGKNCVIGASSIVKGNIPDYSVAVGVPAKVVKYYNQEKKDWVKS